MERGHRPAIGALLHFSPWSVMLESMKTEFECRFTNIDMDAMRKKLRDLGFELTQPEHLMRRKIFSLPDIGGARRWLRLREQAGGATLTLKLKGAATNILSMKEVEVSVGDFALMGELLESAGHKCDSYEENRREKWLKGGIEVCLDTWPGLAPFAEIESDSEENVRTAAAELGFDWKDAMFKSVIEVYEKQGISMAGVHASCTFENPPKAKK